MVQWLGSFSLWAAWCFAGAQGLLPLLGYVYRNPYLLAVARPGAFGQGLFVMLSFFLLIVAFINNDFSIAYVAQNSHETLPLFYRLTAIWGAHEGSILLWIFFLVIWTSIYLMIAADVLTVSILGMISFAFLSFLLWTSNPFAPAVTFLTGQDLNPLLQDPGFMIHPPFLYAGYVGFSLVFAMTQSAIIRHKQDVQWAQITERFTAAALSCLTLGIVLGSWWAYRVLGWGGFWFWDPVENASLLPWLSGVALLHLLVLMKRCGLSSDVPADERFKWWTSSVAMLSFLFSILGTFLVRSGILVSVHTFANDAHRGLFLLGLLVIFVVLLLVVNGTIYYRQMTDSLNARLHPIPFSWFSREMGLLCNSGLCLIALLTIFLGTIYPVLFNALQWGDLSVGAPYFNTVMMPIVYCSLFLMGGSLLQWRQSVRYLLMSVIGAVVILWFLQEADTGVVGLGLILIIWVLLSVFKTHYSRGVLLAHSGFAILIAGILLSSTLSQEATVRLQWGEATRLGPYQFFFVETKDTVGANYRGIQASFDVFKSKQFVTRLLPEKRFYMVRDTVMTKVAIHPGIFRDLYIALGEPFTAQAWSVRLYYKPFIRWIWFGGVLIALGGICVILAV